MIIIIFVYQVASTVITILMYAIFLRALLSWLPNIPYNGFIRILYEITDPLLKPFQRFQFGGGRFTFDISPIFAYLTLMLIRNILMPGLLSMFLGG